VALVKCGECGNDVSTLAAACPKCGAPVPKPQSQSRSNLKPVTAKDAASGFGIAIVVTIAAAFWYLAVDDDKKSPTPASAAAAKPAKTDAECRADLHCWGEKNLAKADVYCKNYVERLAMHAVKWTDSGLFDTKFSRFKWLNQQAGTVTYVGDKVEFQNGFGAYTPMVYACDLGDLDQEAPRVLGARIVTEGRLPP
jgi:hypothetical protein